MATSHTYLVNSVTVSSTTYLPDSEATMVATTVKLYCQWNQPIASSYSSWTEYG